MDKEQAIKQASVLRAELEKLEQIINEPENVRWKPEYNEDYFVLDNNGSFFISTSENHPYDIYRYAIGNCFKTESEAIEYKEKLLFNQEVLDFIARENGDWKADFNGGNNNFCLECWEGSLTYDYTKFRQFTSLNKYFKSKEIGEKILAKFDNEKLKKWFI